MKAFAFWIAEPPSLYITRCLPLGRSWKIHLQRHWMTITCCNCVHVLLWRGMCANETANFVASPQKVMAASCLRASVWLCHGCHTMHQWRVKLGLQTGLAALHLFAFQFPQLSSNIIKRSGSPVKVVIRISWVLAKVLDPVGPGWKAWSHIISWGSWHLDYLWFCEFCFYCLLSFLARNSFMNDKCSKYLDTLDPSRTWNRTSVLHRNRPWVVNQCEHIAGLVAGRDRIGVQRGWYVAWKNKNTFIFRK